MPKPKLKIFFLTLLAILLAGNYYLMAQEIKERIILKEILEKKEKLLIEQNSLLENYFILKEKKEILKLEKEKKQKEISNATITAFNTVTWQTDDTPCLAKFGNICNRDDVVACPRDIPAHTKVIIFNKEYECMDWTALKYNGRFDISFDKDIQGAKEFGKKYTKVIVKL